MAEKNLITNNYLKKVIYIVYSIYIKNQILNHKS